MTDITIFGLRVIITAMRIRLLVRLLLICILMYTDMYTDMYTWNKINSIERKFNANTGRWFHRHPSGGRRQLVSK